MEKILIEGRTFAPGGVQFSPMDLKLLAGVGHWQFSSKVNEASPQNRLPEWSWIANEVHIG